MEFRILLFSFLLLFPHLSHAGWFNNLEKHGSLLRLNSENGARFDPTRVTQLSWNPRAFIYKGFLTPQECDHLIQLAKDKLEKSMVADNESGKSVESQVRTSSGMFLEKSQDDVVSGIEERIAAWTFLPSENGEAMQVLRYELGQKYEPHYDFFHDKLNQRLGGHRIATVLMYLSHVDKGGETVFPNSEALQEKEESWSDCAKKGYADPIGVGCQEILTVTAIPDVCNIYQWVPIDPRLIAMSLKPRKGDALLFFSLHPNASTDPLSLHGSCPVIEGEKWSATKWIHVRSFDNSITGEEEEEEVTSSGECMDLNAHCAEWAKVGECRKNPSYMVGNKVTKGYCRKSCNVC